VVLVTHELESLYSIADRMLFLVGAWALRRARARHAESAKVRDFLRAAPRGRPTHPR
jgi:ABC-type transporter Mla maintaining outer membrane lipid asymmetry ATPase subunit MlaF